MKFITTGILICFFASMVFGQAKNLAFKTGQLKNQKVKEAYDTKWEPLKTELQASNINPDEFDIYIRAFKADKLVEVWMRNKGEVPYHLIKTYSTCTNTGDLGPKRTDDDDQIPEGFYEIELLNPKSNYYLSMQINYPNSSDVILKKGVNAGGDIMLNSDCGTTSCLSLVNDKIKELYVLCLEARNRNTPIYIDIYPTKLSDENIKMLEANYPKSTLSFWKTLKPVYDYFEENKWLPSVSIDRKGHYMLSEDEEISGSKNLSASAKH